MDADIKFDTWPYERVDNIARNGNDGNAYSIWQHVIIDMEIREQEGLKRYGKYLTTDSTEDMLQEAYEEALDLVVYLKAAIMKKDK
jgi:hypothetical protein